MNKKVNSIKKLRIKRNTIKTKNNNRVRVLVYKSLKHDYLQAIDDTTNKTIVSLSTKTINKSKKEDKLEEFAKNFAKKLKTKKINKIVFDKRGYKYHGRIKLICDYLRKNKINF